MIRSFRGVVEREDPPVVLGLAAVLEVVDVWGTTIDEDEDGVSEVDVGWTIGTELLVTEVGTTTTDEEAALVTRVELSVLVTMSDVGCGAEVVANAEDT